MKIVNLTPHTININDLVIPSSGIARAKQESKQVGEIGRIPVYNTVYGEVENLPEPQDGVIYVVSALTAQAVPDREDVYITFGAVRDADGRIIGCTGLAHV